MGLKEKPKNIIYEFYDIDQAGNESPLNRLGGIQFDGTEALSGGRPESSGGGGFNPMGKTAGQQNMRSRAVAGDQGLTARDDMSTILGPVDFKNPVGSTVDTAGTLGLFGNSSAKKRRADASNAGNAGGYAAMQRGKLQQGKFGEGSTSLSDFLKQGQELESGPGVLSQEEAMSRGIGWNLGGSTAEPKEQPEPTSSPEGNEGIKTTGGPTGAINIPTPPKVPSVSPQGGGLSEGEYKLTKIK